MTTPCDNNASFPGTPENFSIVCIAQANIARRQCQDAEFRVQPSRQ